MAENLQNVVSTTINEANGIAYNDTSFDVADASVFTASANFRIGVDDEIMLVTGIASNTLTVTRGQEGTVATAHADKATVVAILTAGALEQYVSENGGGGGGMTNPMTTAGDLIVGGAAGAAGRLGKGSDGDVLQMVSGAVAWGADPGGGGGSGMAVILVPTAGWEQVSGTVTHDGDVFRRLFFSGGGAINNEVSRLIYLPAGTFSIYFHADCGTDRGIIHFRIDDTDVATLDTYNVSDTHVEDDVVTDIVVGSGGLKKLSLKASSKNASSTGYQLVVWSFTIVQTA